MKSTTEPQPSIAVLPFVNMSGDKEQEYFSDGLAEEIINALTQIPKLKVIARTSAFAFKGKDQDIRHIAESLNATNILEGSVRKAGNRIRVTAQLIDTSDGTHLWSEHYDRDMTDVFDIQDEISQAITDKLSVHLTGNHQVVRRHTGNVEAYNLYLKGRYHLYRNTPESLEKSREYLERAIALDPNCAAAWFGLSMYYEMLSFSGRMPAEESLSKCRHAALKALELDKMQLQAHSIIGALHAVEFNWKEAEREFHQALELGPENTDVLLQYCYFYLMPMKRLDEAIPSWQKAVQLDPLSQVVQERLGTGYFQTRQWDLAIAQYHNALELDPHHWMSIMYLGLTYLETGKPDEAIRAGETAVQLSGQSPFPIGYLGYACARAGRIDEARRHLQGLEELSKKSYVLPMSVAMIYFGLGEIDRAFDWFEKAAVEHDALILTIPGFFLFDPLRSHPRYKALLRNMNLEP